MPTASLWPKRLTSRLSCSGSAQARVPRIAAITPQLEDHFDVRIRPQPAADFHGNVHRLDHPRDDFLMDRLPLNAPSRSTTCRYFAPSSAQRFAMPRDLRDT